MNYYPFHIGDYRSATMHLTNEEDLAYRRLLDFYYDTEQPIPLDTQQVSRRLRVGSEQIKTVLQDFFRHTPEGWVHDRCNDEIAEYHRRADRSRANGSKGGRHKSAPPLEKNPAGSQQVPSGIPEPTQGQANQEPVTSNQEPVIEGEQKSKKAARGSRLPNDFALPDDWIAFCEAERPDLNPYDTGKRFVDYWTAKTGQNATKLDWFATWRNWVRDEKARASAGSKAFGESFRERDERVARERAEEFMGRPQRKKPEADVVIDVTPVFFELDHEA